MSDISDKENCIMRNWKESEALAEAMIPLIGKLYRERQVVTNIFGRPLVNQSVIDIIKAHRFVRQVENQELQLKDSFPILKALAELETLGTSRVDIGRLALKYLASEKASTHQAEQGVDKFVQQQVQEATQGEFASYEPQDVVLYGFGRIGRLLARILIEKAGSGNALRLRAIVLRKQSDDDLIKRASLLRRDSVHGPFQGTITADTKNNILIANGNYIQVIYANSPDTIDYTQYGIDNAIVVDNTGIWRDAEGLGLHLKSKGVSRVLLTAPGKGAVKNIVFGVNQESIAADDTIVSAASCTTNAIVPVLKVVNDHWGIVAGHVETVHSYTNDQNLIDNFHKGNRRGRSAPLNMVITETGAAKAVVKALPELANKLTGNAIRVPTPNVSMAILNLELESSDQEISKEAINDFLRRVSLYSPLRKQIDYVNSPEVVSTDFVGSRYASVVDAQSTIVNGKRCVLYIWYDNEFGYSSQVVRLLQKMAGIAYAVIPKDEFSLLG